MSIYPEELVSKLDLLFKVEKEISEIIRSHGLRFSINKITGDLGEFYAFQKLKERKDIFDDIVQNKNSNAAYDFMGILNNSSSLFNDFGKKEIKIEVKTRRNQEGTKYLSSLKPEKFDLLCLVDIAENYGLNKVYLIKSETANKQLDNRYNRLIFKEDMAFMTL